MLRQDRASILTSVLRSYRYRLTPTRAQDATLMTWLRLTRELYNAALQERRDAWQKQRARVTEFDQMHALVEIRKVRPEFQALPIIVLRGAIRRLDRAFAGFFRRCKAHEKPGYPRFRGRNRWCSLLLDDLGGKVPICAGGRRIKVPLLGKVKVNLHRPLEGTPKAMRLKLDGDGHWYVTFACIDVPTKPLPPTGRDVGVDVGLATFAATSDGEMFANPRPLAATRLKVERAQRVVSRRVRGSGRRRAAGHLLGRLHAHVANVRRQHAIDVARALVAKYDTIYVEALNIQGLACSMLAKSVHDAGWGVFLHWLGVKAEEAGRQAVEVNPSGTSQVCSDCGAEVRKTLAVRVHDCPHCGYVVDRDVNAARNILALGRSVRGEARAAGRPRRSAKSKLSVGPDRSTPRGLTDGAS